MNHAGPVGDLRFYNLHIRLGFIKVAIREGCVERVARVKFTGLTSSQGRLGTCVLVRGERRERLSTIPDLVPRVLIIGQIYQQMPNQKGTTIHALQKKFQNVFGFTLPLFHGRGLLNCTRERPFVNQRRPS